MSDFWICFEAFWPYEERTSALYTCFLQPLLGIDIFTRETLYLRLFKLLNSAWSWLVLTCSFTNAGKRLLTAWNCVVAITHWLSYFLSNMKRVTYITFHLTDHDFVIVYLCLYYLYFRQCKWWFWKLIVHLFNYNTFRQDLETPAITKLD